MSKKNNLINTERKIKSYLKKIRKDEILSKLILGFYLVGSRKEGTNREDSDWDVLIHTKVKTININKRIGRVDGYNIDFSTTTEKPEADEFN